jgi:hypothetical protein
MGLAQGHGQFSERRVRQIGDRTTSDTAPFWLLIAVALAAIALRLIFIWGAPAIEGDGVVYTTVALNILRNGCVSLSDPTLGACIPHWGGNQLPGYPTFIALSWALTDDWVRAPLVAQSIAFGVAAAYVVKALMLSGNGLRVAMVASAVLVASPTQIAWPRMLLTETLAAAAALWILAATIRSLSEGRFRTIEIGIAFAIGFFIRYDFIFLAVPIAVLAFYLHAPTQALRRGITVALIAAIPFGAWTMRNAAVGLSPLPPSFLDSNGHALPSGVLRWIGTWVVSPYDLPISVWPLATGEYASIQPPDRAFANPSEREAVAGLLAKLGPTRVGPMPPQIDASFADLAEVRRRDFPVQQRVGLPLRRAAELWLSPLPSMGWPGEIGVGRSALLAAAKSGDVKALFRFVQENAGPAIAKGLVAAWRYAVLGGLAFIIVATVLGYRRYPALIWLATALAVVTTGVLGSAMLVEARYLVPAMAWLEVAVAVTLARKPLISAGLSPS